MHETQDLLQIGDFAKLASTNLRTLRYYEELGLIEPASRSSGGFRLYSRGQLGRMSAIKRLQDLGLPLKEIAEALRVQDPTSGTEVRTRLQAILERQIGLLDGRMRQMNADLEALSEARCRLLEVCGPCDTPFTPNNCDPCPRDQLPIPKMLRALM